MRFELLVCVLALAVGCSDAGANDTMPSFGTQAGGPATDVVPGPQSPTGPTAVAPTPGPMPAGPTPVGTMSGPVTPPTPSGPTEPVAGPGPETPPPDSMTPDGPAPDPMTPTAPTTPVEPQDCSGLTGSPGRTVEMVDNAGVARRYILHVPSSYTGDEPVPLVVVYHPLLTDGAAAERGSGFKELADREGFVVAFPYGQESAAWNAGPCCTASRDVDDVGFSRALVAQIESKYCIDKKRVYATGYSMGGGMTHYLACEAADIFAAVATGAFDLFAENTCAPSRPISVISFRSMTDTIVPYAGGEKTSAPNGFRGKHTFLGAVGTFDRWAEIDGCTDQPEDTGGGCQTHKQCDAGVEVTLCTVAGGHIWPDTERSWETMKRFTLP